MLYVRLLYADSDYPFGIFKLFLSVSLDCPFLIAFLVFSITFMPIPLILLYNPIHSLVRIMIYDDYFKSLFLYFVSHVLMNILILK